MKITINRAYRFIVDADRLGQHKVIRLMPTGDDDFEYIDIEMGDLRPVITFYDDGFESLGTWDLMMTGHKDETEVDVRDGSYRIMTCDDDEREFIILD
jgi:hypothetical protein